MEEAIKQAFEQAFRGAFRRTLKRAFYRAFKGAFIAASSCELPVSSWQFAVKDQARLRREFPVTKLQVAVADGVRRADLCTLRNLWMFLPHPQFCILVSAF